MVVPFSGIAEYAKRTNIEEKLMIFISIGCVSHKQRISKCIGSARSGFMNIELLKIFFCSFLSFFINILKIRIYSLYKGDS
jgi:hypothetical protein